MDRLESQDAVTKCDPKMQDGSLVLSDMRPLIHDIRGVQVMLDRDLAAAYQVSTAAFNQAVKRNANRFSETFRFQLTKDEHEVLISQKLLQNQGRDGLRPVRGRDRARPSQVGTRILQLPPQIVTSKRKLGEETRGGYHKLPFAFTEQGIAMLSGVLRSDVAVNVSIQNVALNSGFKVVEFDHLKRSAPSCGNMSYMS